MLQRAAGNAYSWWWASHIRTKQSKWLEQSIQEMEEKVSETLKIIDNQGDSFAQRAEMYYRKRPELVAFVEETFKAYRALAERYDKLSKQLQSANRTIATVCPEHVRYHIEEDDDEGGLEMPFPSGDDNHEFPPTPAGNIPKVPKFPGKDFRSQSMRIARKGPPKRMVSSARTIVIPCSGLNKTEALEQIDKLQKEILSLQTEKEFVKGVYVRAYEKFWEIENKIVEMQKTVYNLQDEFGVGTIIEDDEARALMASTALRSCQETLEKLQQVQVNLSDEAQEEYQRLKEAHERFEMLRDEFISKHVHIQEVGDLKKLDPTKQHSNGEVDDAMEEVKQDQGLLRERIKLQLEKNGDSSMTVTELADRIDELVDRVATLETSSASQTVLVQRLKSETDELHSNVNKLEDDKEKIIQDADQTKTKLKDLEDELKRVKDLNQTVRKGNNGLQSNFTEVSCNLEHLSERLQNVKPDEEEEETVWFKKRSPKKNEEEHKDGDSESLKEKEEADTVKLKSIGEEHNATDMPESRGLATEEEHDQPNWRQMFIDGLDDREKILLDEYTSVLRNYKEVRLKLNEVEKKNRETILELVSEIRGLKSSLSSKDKVIQFLHQKMNISDTNPDGSPSTVGTEYKYTPNEGLSEERDKSDSTANWQDSLIAYQKLFSASMEVPSAESREESSSSVGNSKHSDVRQGSEEKSEVDHAGKPRVLSTLEMKLRADIDDLLEENLEFWLRYSTSVHQIQKFQNSVQDLRGDILRVREKIGRGNPRQISEVRAIYIHFREIQTELTLWLEHNSVLEDELEGRLSTLMNIQDEITSLSSAGSRGDKAELSDYQAAKFHGEILNMKQENKKVSKELRSGLDHVTELKIEVDNIVTKLEEEFDLNNQSQMKRSMSKPRIPLRSFLFGVKLKKKSAQKASLFSCVNPNIGREYHMPPLPEPPR